MFAPDAAIPVLCAFRVEGPCPLLTTPARHLLRLIHRSLECTSLGYERRCRDTRNESKTTLMSNDAVLPTLAA